MSRFCQRFRAHAVSDRARMVRMRCKQWTCEYCSRINSRQWQMHLKKHIPRGKRWSFLTITAPAWAHDAGVTASILSTSWDSLMKRLRRAWGRFSYVRVYEAHESGEIHAHMLASVWSDDYDCDASFNESGQYRGTLYKDLKGACVGVGLGYICDIRPVRTPNNSSDIVALSCAIDDPGVSVGTNHVVAYVTKYMTKATRPLPAHCRRIQTSRDIKPISSWRDETDETWSMIDKLSYTDLLRFESERVIDLTRRCVVTLDWFEQNSTTLYPLDNDN